MCISRTTILHLYISVCFFFLDKLNLGKKSAPQQLLKIFHHQFQILSRKFQVSQALNKSPYIKIFFFFNFRKSIMMLYTCTVYTHLDRTKRFIFFCSPEFGPFFHFRNLVSMRKKNMQVCNLLNFFIFLIYICHHDHLMNAIIVIITRVCLLLY